MPEYTAYTYLPGNYDMFGRPMSKEKKEVRCRTLESGIKEMISLFERARGFHSYAYLESNGKFVAQLESGPVDGVYKIHTNGKNSYIGGNGKTITDKVYVVSASDLDRRCKTFKEAVLTAVRLGYGTRIAVCEPDHKMNYVVKENSFTKNGPMLEWHGMNPYYREYYTIGKDGSIRFIPYYTATVGGDNEYGDEFFKEVNFTASSKDAAKKKAVEYMERIATKNRNATVFNVTLDWHPKKFEFQRDYERICTIYYEDTRL